MISYHIVVNLGTAVWSHGFKLHLDQNLRIVAIFDMRADTANSSSPHPSSSSSSSSSSSKNSTAKYNDFHLHWRISASLADPEAPGLNLKPLALDGEYASRLVHWTVSSLVG